MKRDWMRVKLDRFFQRPRSSSEEQSGQNDVPMENSGIEVLVPNETDEGELRSEPMDVDGAGGSSSSSWVSKPSRPAKQPTPLKSPLTQAVVKIKPAPWSFAPRPFKVTPQKAFPKVKIAPKLKSPPGYPPKVTPLSWPRPQIQKKYVNCEQNGHWANEPTCPLSAVSAKGLVCGASLPKQPRVDILRLQAGRRDRSPAERPAGSKAKAEPAPTAIDPWNDAPPRPTGDVNEDFSNFQRGHDGDRDYLREPKRHAFPSIQQGRSMREFQNLDLPVIDPFQHEGVWAIPDDGCNSTTQGEEWMINVCKKLRKKGETPMLDANKSTSFFGVGRADARGQFKIPFCLRLKETGFVPHGTVVTWEAPGEKFPMLLSQSVQAKMGFL